MDLSMHPDSASRSTWATAAMLRACDNCKLPISEASCCKSKHSNTHALPGPRFQLQACDFSENAVVKTSLGRSQSILRSFRSMQHEGVMFDKVILTSGLQIEHKHIN